MDANGQYTYTRTGGVGGSTDSFTYTYVDRDGDPATATLVITIADETPVAGNVNILLDDDVAQVGSHESVGWANLQAAGLHAMFARVAHHAPGHG